MASKAQSRIGKELAAIKESPLSFASFQPQSDMVWHVVIDGPPGSPYEEGKFKVEIQFSDNYPFKAPEVHFITQIYHPNVSMKNHGAICPDAIGVGNEWSPLLKVSDIVTRLHALLLKPNGATPLEADIGEQFNNDAKKFAQVAKQWTTQHAK